MDNNYSDLEAGTISNIPRTINKKIRKRKHLDALLKFRSTKKTSNDILRSSEDELFLPHQKRSINKFRSSRYRRCWYYCKHILSFSLICIFIILCIALVYANIELKNEVQNLSSRIDQIEKKISRVDLNNVSSIIKQIQTRLDFLEQWNTPSKDDSAKLQRTELKSTQFSDIKNQLDDYNQKTESQIEKMTNEWNSFRNELENFKQITNLVHNSSDKTSMILTELKSNLDQLHTKIDECRCSKESIHFKPSIVDSDQLQQSLVTKPNVLKLTSTTSSKNLVSNENKKTENATDVDQIVNQPSVTG